MPGVVLFAFAPGALESGCTVRAVNTSQFEQPAMDEPNEAQAQDDGSAEVAVVCATGDQVCFTAFDASGNASGQTCLNVTPVIGVPADEQGAKTAFSLTSGNPVRNQARFQYSLPRRTRVELSVYDVNGRRFATLLSGEQEAGDHEVVWRLDRPARPAPGIYFARFRAGTFESVERLVLAR